MQDFILNSTSLAITTYSFLSISLAIIVQENNGKVVSAKIVLNKIFFIVVSHSYNYKKMIPPAFCQHKFVKLLCY